jgi:acyl-coenzyme A synthetase/AMP-(fatty) acid ligase
VFQGEPTYLDVGRCWDMLEKHKVTTFYTAPTAIRGAGEPELHLHRHQYRELLPPYSIAKRTRDELTLPG